MDTNKETTSSCGAETITEKNGVIVKLEDNFRKEMMVNEDRKHKFFFFFFYLNYVKFAFVFFSQLFSLNGLRL